MPHLDEGTLHALLDGELDVTEVKEVQTHLGACSACGSRLQDVKQFLAEADSLVEALQAPAGAPRSERAPAPPPGAATGSPPNAGPWREPVWDAAPELLLPEDPEEVLRRRRWNRRFRWAAMIALVLGAGQLARTVLGPGGPQFLNERDVVSSVPPTPAPVISPEETSRPEPPAAKSPRTTAAARPPASKSAANQPAALAKDAVAETALTSQFDTTVLARVDTSSPAAGAEIAAATQADTGRADSAPSERREEGSADAATSDAATRQAAAAALEELDRERMRSRANAATAALPPPPPPSATVEPAARTLEQKSQIYLRIGLDEAAQQLGRPMHVIEAMSPEFVGLSQGRLVPGADPNRPVVRVVYRDQRGRMILLDQQRLRTGQAPGASSGSLRWIQGDVMLYLHGEPGNDVLRNLQRRVR
jgi:bacterioferritin-associated ferredoxin